MQTFLYKLKSGEVCTLNKDGIVHANSDSTYYYDSGLPYFTKSMGCWFGSNFHYAKLQTSGELTLCTVDSSFVESIVLNAGVKNWQSAYVHKLNDGMLLFLCLSDLEFFVYTWDGTSSNLFSCPLTSQRIWDVFVFDGKFYCVMDRDIACFFLGQIPSKMNLNTNMHGGSLFELGGSLYLLNPMQMDLFISKVDVVNNRLAPQKSLVGITVYPYQSSVAMLNGEAYLMFSHQYGRIFYRYNGVDLKSLNIVSDLMFSPSDSLLFEQNNEIYCLSSVRFNSNCFFCIYPRFFVKGNADSFWMNI